MNKLKMRCVQSNASDSTLGCFRGAVFSVANHRVVDGRKLHADLILQSCHQRNADERSLAKKAFDGIPKLSASRCRVAPHGQPLEHSFSPQVVNQSPFFSAEMPANNGEILPQGSMSKKLPNQRVSIVLGFCKEENPRRETINAMYDKDPLFLRFQFCGKKRQGGRRIGAFDRHSQKSGRFIERHDGIVFVEDGTLR